MIVFDLQAVQSVDHSERGIARFVAELASTLAREHPGLVDAFVWNDAATRGKRIDQLGLGDSLCSYSDLRGADVDVLHINSPVEVPAISDLLPPVRAKRLVVTCYDLIPALFPDLYLAETGFRARYRTRLGLLASADAVLTDSQSAADDVHRLLGVARRRLTVIGAGVSGGFVPPTTSLEQRLGALRDDMPEIESRFILVPTGIDPRKNTDTVIEAYALLPAAIRNRHQLVLSCRLDVDQRADLDAMCARFGVDGRVMTTGYVSDEVLITLYQSAELVVFPSLYEGFGLPVLEARRCGAPVICSNSSSLPEVLVDGECRFNPGVPGEIAGMIERAVTDAQFGAQVRAVPDAGFTWSRAARLTADVYRSEQQRARASTRSTPSGVRRLAIVTPLPPARTGVADHSSRLITSLVGRGVEVTAFAPHPLPGLHHGQACDVYHVAALPQMWAAGEFDEVVYCLGNHPIHRSFIPLLRVVPGHVFLHDVRLRGAVDGGSTDDDPHALFVKSVAQRAVSVLVQSNYAGDLVRSVADADVHDVGPHPCPPVHDPVDRVGRVEIEPLWVVSLGAADETKGSDVVADAMRLVASDRVRAAMVGTDAGRFVGDDDPIVADDYVSEPEFVAWLERASVMVQLRRTSNGESSGVVAHALAHGVPVIVTGIGPMCELPDDVVVKVPVDIDGPELADTISELVGDEGCRRTMGAAARAFAERHTMDAQAASVIDVVFGNRAGSVARRVQTSA